jgi:hypothetical protein
MIIDIHLGSLCWITSRFLDRLSTLTLLQIPRDYHMQVVDIRHLLNESLTGPELPQLKFKVRILTEIITYATGKEAGVSVDVLPRCWREPKRIPCAGKLETSINHKKKQIHWWCPECGDEGVVTGWEGLVWDMTGSSSGLIQ